jgi:hypothetical protein
MCALLRRKDFATCADFRAVGDVSHFCVTVILRHAVVLYAAVVIEIQRLGADT